MAEKEFLTIRPSPLEQQFLEEYCALTQRKKTDVVREFLRSLEGEIKRIKKDRGES